MKVCLINPPIEDFYSTSIRRQPLGLLYIASALKNAGHEISFINCHTPKKQALPIPKEFSYLNKFIIGNSKHKFPFKDYYHFGMSFQEIERQVKNSSADVYFISALFTAYYQEVMEIISIIKRQKKNGIIAVGGYHAALYPEFFLNECSIDYVISGEGEKSSIELLDFLSGKIDKTMVTNLIYSDNYKIKHNNNDNCKINTLTFPARDLLKKRDIKYYKKNFISMIASRGCPNSCTFCTGKSIWGNAFRMRKIDSILNEIELCIKKYDAGIINFEDDNLLPSKTRALEFLHGLKDLKKTPGKDLEFTAMNGISLENLDEEIIYKMKDSGFREINISLVSYSRDIQKKLSRPFDSERFRIIARTAKKLDMNVRTYFILGLPEQTRDEIDGTIGFLRDLNVKLFPSIYYNVNAPQNEWKMQRSSGFYNESKNLSRNDLIEYFNRCFINSAIFHNKNQ